MASGILAPMSGLTMSGLTDSTLRLVAFVIAVVAIAPAAILVLRHMLTLHEPGATRRARTLDVLWAVVPLVALVALVLASGMA